MRRLALLLPLCVAGRAAAQDSARAGLKLVPVAHVAEPVHLTAPAGDPRLFIVEQAGRIWIVAGGHLLPRPFLDIHREVGGGGERGLLSLAFHPRYRDNGRFYVDYTDLHGDTHVARFTADPAADSADPATEQLVLFVAQPYANHNGGHILFGPDGKLYVGMGDGGSQMDPHGNGQSTTTLLGKLLRLDVDAREPYAIPPDNPFAGGGGRPEIWAIGLRNPWRIAFDSGQVYIADVGQNAWEEVDVEPANAAGLNYGWRPMEGTHCLILVFCRKGRYTPPRLEYSHRDGCAIIGGVVYRGRAIPALAGHYLYSDYCTGFLRSFRYVDGAVRERTSWAVQALSQVSSFGEDGAHEVYLLTQDGVVYRIEAR